MSTLRRRKNRKEIKRIEKEFKKLGIIPYYEDADGDKAFDSYAKETVNAFKNMKSQEIAIDCIRLGGLDIDYDIVSLPNLLRNK